MNLEKNLSAKNLKEILWEVLLKLRAKEIDVREADSIAIQAREIIRTISSQKSIIQMANLQMPEELKNYAIQE